MKTLPDHFKEYGKALSKECDPEDRCGDSRGRGRTSGMWVGGGSNCGKGGG